MRGGRTWCRASGGVGCGATSPWTARWSACCPSIAAAAARRRLSTRPPPRPLHRPAHRPGASEAALALRRNPHTDAHVRLAHTAATEPTPSASRRSAPHAQTPPLPPHPCPRRPAAADSPHPTPVPTRLPPPQHPALAHIRRAWPGAHRINHQRRARLVILVRRPAGTPSTRVARKKQAVPGWEGAPTAFLGRPQHKVGR